MSSSVKITGFNNFEKLIKNLEKQTKDLSGLVSLDKLLTPEFMSKNTQFSSFDE